eukprot:8766574-Pyramimonas_sp.AAC.1
MRQDPVPTLEVFDGTNILHHPKDIVDHKTSTWKRKWAPKLSEPHESIIHVLGIVRQAVRDDPDPLPELGVPEVRKALRAMKPRA